jgi:hypothetical protein
MTALIGTNGNALDILLKSGGNNVVHRAVMPKVDDLGATCLENAAHDVDSGIVAIEQAGRGDEANFVLHIAIARDLALNRANDGGHVILSSA